MTHEDLVREFMVKHDQFRAGEPTPHIPMDVKILRLRLMMEELGEVAMAIHSGDLELIADGLADLEYVVVGTAIAFGIPHSAVFKEVHRSNMTKRPLDKTNKGGKVTKEGYEPPQITEVITRALLAQSSEK